jgi:hypothetical protein
MSKSEWIDFVDPMIKAAPEEPGVFELGAPQHIEYIGYAPRSLSDSLACFKANVAGVGTDKCLMFRWVTCPEPCDVWHQAIDYYYKQHNEYPSYNLRQMERKRQLGQNPNDPMP